MAGNRKHRDGYDPQLTGASKSARMYEDLKRHVLAAPEGQAVASERKLAGQFGVSYMTARGVVGRLVEEGLLDRVHGKGTFVAPRSASETATVLFIGAWQDLEHPFCFRKLKGLVEYADANGLRLQVLRYRHGESLGQQTSILAELARPDIMGVVTEKLSDELIAAARRTRSDRPLVSNQPSPFPGVVLVDFDRGGLGSRAGLYLGEQGARRIFCVHTRKNFLTELKTAVGARWPDAQVSGVPVMPLADTEPVVARILRERPDGLAFSDDRVARRTLLLIERADAAYYHALRIVSHANAGEDLLPPEVARLEVDGYEVGYVSMSTLHSLARSPGSLSQTEILIAPRLRVPAQV